MGALARLFESAGLSTVVINMMPQIGEWTGAPRTLGVGFPFGLPVGPPGDAGFQTRVVRAALELLQGSEPPGPVVAHFPEPWPLDFDSWKRAWHPREPSPIIRWMIEQRALKRS